MNKTLTLKDVRIIEYGNMICVPYCGKMLADLGAEVIKIEKPVDGDIARRRAPFAKDTPGLEHSGFFIYLNTNKLGVTLNLDKATGKGIFKKLIKDADILLEDTAPGTLNKLGVGYEQLRDVNPRLIMTSVTPFGQTGPYKNYKSSDLIAFQMSGIGFVTPRWVGTTDHEPLRVTQMADFIAAQGAAVATMSALHVQREKKFGQHVDVSQLEAILRLNAQNTWHWPYELVNETRASRSSAGPQQFFRCKDGWCYLHAEEQHHWHRFVEIMGNPEWAQVGLFQDAPSRAEHWDGLKSLIEEWAMQHTKMELFEAAKGRIPLAPSNTVDEAMGLRHLKEREYFVNIDHPVAGEYTYPGAPYKSTRSEWSIRRAAPLLGQDNEEVYCKRLGYTREELVKLVETGII